MIRELLTLYLEDWGAVVTAVATADAGKLELMKQDWALLLTDVQTPGLMNGVDLAWIASQLNPETRLIVMSGYYDFVARALPDNALFLPKTWPVTKLQEMILTSCHNQQWLNRRGSRRGLALESTVFWPYWT